MDTGGNVDIFVLDLPSGNLHRLTTSLGADLSPSWSPDGRMIAFRSDRTGNDEVFVMNADGTGQRDLTNDPGSDYSPVWSPDGRTIAFASSRGDDTGNDIWLMNPDGSHQRALFHQKGIDEYPVWSPDASHIAFNCTLGRVLPSHVGDFDICVVDVHTRRIAKLTEGPGLSGVAGWSPDGTRMSFASSRNDDPSGVSGCGDLFTMRRDGTGLRQLTSGPAHDCGGSWSRDGRWILFSSDRTALGGTSDIFVIAPDGSALTRLTSYPSNEQDPALYPD